MKNALLSVATVVTVGLLGAAGPASQGGSVTGTVKFTGTPPANPKLDMSEEAACKGKYATDPVVRRAIFGIARINLLTKNVDFTPIGPAAPMNRFFLTPDRKKGYTVTSSGQGGNRRTEFWVFDVTARKVIKKLEFESRSRFAFAVSSDGRKLYIYGAGPTIEIYDADTLTLERTITLDGDAITQLLVLRPQS